MSHYCEKCGRPLTEGEVCYCDVEHVEYQGNEANNTLPTEIGVKKKVNTANIDFSKYVNEIVNVFKGIFSKPVDTIKDFISEDKYISGIVLLVLTAISGGIYRIAYLKSTYNPANDLISKLGNYFMGEAPAKPAYFKEFFKSFGGDVLRYALIVLAFYVIVNTILKLKGSYKQAINVVAISFVALIIANLLKTVLVFSDSTILGYVSSYISTFSYLFEIIVLSYGIKEVTGIDKNKLLYVIPSILISATCVYDILRNLFK